MYNALKGMKLSIKLEFLEYSFLKETYYAFLFFVILSLSVSYMFLCV